MSRILPASAFAQGVIVYDCDVFEKNNSQAKISWADWQLQALLDHANGVLRFTLNIPNSPSAATYLSWLNVALVNKQNLSDVYRLQSKQVNNMLHVRLVERESGKPLETPHVIHKIIT